MKDIPVEEYFTYHPVMTDGRRVKHESINHTALEFAKLIEHLVKDERCKEMAFFALQQCRMFANQGITIDELRSLKDD